MDTPVLSAAIVGLLIGIGMFTLLVIRTLGPSRAKISADGYQELEVVVKGRYSPNMIEVERGIPVRLHFRREEDNPCSERVIFSDFHVGSRLPANETTPVCFIPTKCGEFLFTCAMGMYQGKLIVVQPSKQNSARSLEKGGENHGEGSGVRYAGR